MNVHDEDAAAALEALATVEDDYRSTILADQKLSIAYANRILHGLACSSECRSP